MKVIQRADSNETRAVPDALVLDEVLERLLEPLDRLGALGADPGTEGADRLTATADANLPAPTAVRARRANDIFTSVTLHRRNRGEAERPIVRFNVSEPCSSCIAGEPEAKCRECGGIGTVEVERALRLLIPAGVGDGTELFVRGEGNVSPQGPPGDLFVHVRVLPGARSPIGAQQYTLFAAAVVVLAVFVYLRFL